MRATKGLWAALGAGVSIAAAGLLLLATMSVVLAVGGWPDGHTVDRDGTIALRAQRATHTTRVAAAGRRPVAPARRAAGRTAAHRAARQFAARSLTRRPSGAAPSAKVSVPATSGAAQATPSGGATTVGAPVTKATGTAGANVTSVTGAAGQILDPVSQPVGDTVGAVGQQAGQTIDQVGQTVGGLTGSK